MSAKESSKAKHIKDIMSLPIQEKRNLFRSMGRDHLRDLLASVKNEFIAELVKDIPSDELTDIVECVDKNRHSAILELFDPKKAARIAQLLLYGKDTAGGIMATEFLAFDEKKTIDEVINKIRTTPPEESRVFYLYVINEDGNLKGVISIRDLITKTPSLQVKDIMHKAIVSIPHTMDKETAANLFEKYSFLALPVTDEASRIIGVVTADDITRVAREEATEDMLKLSGMSSDDLSMETPVIMAVKKRLPWLLVNMLLDAVAVSVVAYYQGTLQAVIAIAVLMPIISDMGGNAGFQGLSLVIRDFALGKLPVDAFWRVFKKQTMIGFIIGVALGLEFALLAYLWKWNPYLGLVAGFAMFLNVYIAGLVGALLPMFLKSIKVDPAVATAPVLTTLTDLTGFTIILFLASKTIEYIK